VAALEGLDFHNTCNALCPGAVDTPNTRRTLATQRAQPGKTRRCAHSWSASSLPAGWSMLVAGEQIGAIYRITYRR
jgi:NAD(P)-dependent dehydrogenase (short-subunit alcohol dehydrogenase family)